MFNDIITKIKHIPYRIFIAKSSGALRGKKDDRNFLFGIFGFGDYKPKHSKRLIETLSIKDQGQLNTCVFNATIVCKEIDEKCILSVKSVVRYAKRKGMISGDGFAAVDAGEKVLKDFGAQEESELPSTLATWPLYSDGPINMSSAEKHKISSYWEVEDLPSIYKLLDNGKALKSAIDWYTGFNQGGGFKAPWIIDRRIGLRIGGHEMAIIGYDRNYNGKDVLIVQNSYGKYWGDMGKYYVDVKYFMNNNYGVYTDLDIAVNIGEFLNKYDGKNVKGDSSPAIYHIQKGKKKPYLDWVTFLAWNGKEDGFETVKQADIDAVEKGDNMDITKTVYWPFLQNVKKDDMINQLLNILYKK